MRTFLLIVACLLVSLTLVTTATAEEPPKPCVEDAQKLCKGVKPGEGRIHKCLWEKRQEVSPACKANAKAYTNKVIKACKADAKKLCEGVKPGGGRVAKCLFDKSAEVSQGCKDAIAGK